MKTVQILFTPSVMAAIIEKVEASNSDYKLPEDFAEVGQTFNDVQEAYTDEGFFMVAVPDRKDPSKSVEYYYPAHSIARVKVSVE